MLFPPGGSSRPAHESCESRFLRYIAHPPIIKSEFGSVTRCSEARDKGFNASLNCVPVPVTSPSESLSYLEKKVLLALGERTPASPEEIRTAGGFKELVEVMNASSWLVSKGLVTMRERVQRRYTLAKRQWATKALPERRLLRELRKMHGKANLEALRKRAKMSEQEFSIALGWMRKKGWAGVERDPKGTLVGITDRGGAALDEKS